MNQKTKAGDFTGLAKSYSNSRPDYSESVLNSIIGLINKPSSEISFADVGAGTGIWTRMVEKKITKKIYAVEPNDDMRENGIKDSQESNIEWFKGSAEATGLVTESLDWISMASSFHWADFSKATTEFTRVLKKGGFFTAIWNPRLIEVNPLLVEIEEYAKKLRPTIKRVSSGRSGITTTLTNDLWDCGLFDDVVYMEGRHIIKMSTARYLDAWKSVNDMRVQLGEEGFENFLSFVTDKVSNLEHIDATYLTRSWSARKA